MTQSTPELEVRTEAHPLKWEELSAGQRKAGEMVKALVNKFLAELPDKPERVPASHGIEAVLPRIDLHRTTNRVILIDGSRGSGKTALLVSLIHEWSEAVRGFGPEGQKLAGPNYRILPVGVVDLRPMPDATSVLFSIVGSFHKLVDLLDHEGGNQQDRFGGGGDPSKLRQTWDRLLRSVSTWKRDLGERAKDLDPEQFVAEFTDIEQRRLHLDTAFGDFMDELAYVFHSRNGIAPLFVIAIDDADLNRTVSLELLDLLRKLWHRNVAYVLTGDKQLFRLGVRCDFRDMFSSTSTEARGATQRVEARDEEWIEQIVEKLLPQGHVCSIPELTRNERFALVAECLVWAVTRCNQRAFDSTRKRIWSTGNRDANTAELRRRSIADFMRAQPQTMDALPSHFRPLLALKEWLVQNRSRLSDAIPEVLRHLSGMDSDFVTQLPQGRLGLATSEYVLQTEETGRHRQLWSSADCAHMLTVCSSEFGYAELDDVQKLSRRPLAALILGANIVSDSGGEMPSGFTANLGRDWVAASFILVDESDKQIRFPWLAPKGWNSECHHLLFDAWKRSLDAVFQQELKESDDVGFWVRLFSRIVYDVGRQRGSGEFLDTGNRLDPDHELLAWRTILADIKKLASAKGPTADWARCAFWAFAAPEIGLPIETATLILKEYGELPGANLSALKKYRDERLELIAYPNENDKTAALSLLSQKFSSHPWYAQQPTQAPANAVPRSASNRGERDRPKRPPRAAKAAPAGLK